MTYNHPKRDNCDRGSQPAPTVRKSMYVHYYLHKTFHVEHCTYTRRGNCPQLQPLVLPQFMHL